MGGGAHLPAEFNVIMEENSELGLQKLLTLPLLVCLFGCFIYFRFLYVFVLSIAWRKVHTVLTGA